MQQKFAHYWASPGTTGVMSKICCNCRPAPRSHQERCGLPLESRVPGRLRPTQDPPHHQPHHCLPGLQPTIPVVCRRLHRRPWRNPRTSTGRQRAHYLLCLALPQPGGESLPRHETEVPCHRLGRRQISPLPDIDVIRGLYRPLCTAVTQDDAHRIRPPSSMVSRAGRIRFYRKTPTREVTNPRRWTKPLTCRPATARRRHPANTAAGR